MRNMDPMGFEMELPQWGFRESWILYEDALNSGFHPHIWWAQYKYVASVHIKVKELEAEE